MMIADLVDQEDLCNYLLQIGAPIAQGSDPRQAVETTLSWLQTQPADKRRDVDRMAQQLMSKPELLLPAVKSALESLLTRR
ncbi:hypothetical protein BTA51_27720 [Hahella sp. CCB-MM4]|uniref:hypothetical protein n=1 Tax=Hahella sp. (strain CCB-MM4) TaxID=1926491 RepID=UPI000B9BE478|nr:hypothetical protein [Hahella sp. CCB-MM4]OZG70074.1 hypothetical protein BTA51_27720 [Hahella sp. CCB-MM4]